MAEREGFEPSEEFNPFAGLANLWFKPLTHLSMLLPQRFFFIYSTKILTILSISNYLYITLHQIIPLENDL